MLSQEKVSMLTFCTLVCIAVNELSVELKRKIIYSRRHHLKRKKEKLRYFNLVIMSAVKKKN